MELKYKDSLLCEEALYRVDNLAYKRSLLVSSCDSLNNFNLPSFEEVRKQYGKEGHPFHRFNAGLREAIEKKKLDELYFASVL